MINAPPVTAASTTTTAPDNPAMIRFLAGNRKRGGRGTWRVLGDQPSRVVEDAGGQIPIVGGIDDVDTASQNREGFASSLQGPDVGGGVDPAGESADNRPTGGCDRIAEAPGDRSAVLGAAAGPDDCHAGHRGHFSTHPEVGRRLRDSDQQPMPSRWCAECRSQVATKRQGLGDLVLADNLGRRRGLRWSGPLS